MGLSADNHNFTLMDADEFLSKISVATGKQQALELARQVVESGMPLGAVVDLSFHRKKATAFRAAWILEIIADKYPSAFGDVAGYFILRYPEQQNQSCRRHFAGIMLKLAKGKCGHLPEDADIDKVVEKSFEWLIDPLAPVAVQANCMDVLCALRGRYEWIAGELREQIGFLMRNGSAAIQARGKRVLAELGVTTKSDI